MTISLTQVTRNSHVRAILGALLVSVCGLACIGTLVCFVLVHVNRPMAGNRDFVVYWATGQQLVQHRNPYDAAALPAVEHAAGLPHRYSVGYMRNPPWTLPLAWPLGLLNLRAAAVLASLLLIGALIASVRILLGIHGCRDRLVQGLAYLFAPALICLIWGQTSLLVLLGLVLFLRFHATRPILAGASLWLCTLKPHLLLPVGVVFLAWVVITRNYRIVAGAAAAFLLSVLVTFRLDPQAWTQYTHMLGYSGVERDPIPVLSVLLRTHLTPNFMAMQFLPAAMAGVWALVYFWNRRHDWNWSRDVNLLLLVSLVAAPYAYLNDQVLVLPALLFAASRNCSRALLAFLALASALLEVAFFLNLWSPAPFYWATLLAAPFWLAWYLFARSPSRRALPCSADAINW
ncbi:MAG TPA: glycosyltransferase family 87 protein [Terracidiphilus sp.]|jgi:hypothetical protein|nr:glycosyltransferase family 87 protein [Terracidiphilus sp.]